MTLTTNSPTAAAAGQRALASVGFVTVCLAAGFAHDALADRPLRPIHRRADGDTIARWLHAIGLISVTGLVHGPDRPRVHRAVPAGPAWNAASAKRAPCGLRHLPGSLLPRTSARSAA